MTIKIEEVNQLIIKPLKLAKQLNSGAWGFYLTIVAGCTAVISCVKKKDVMKCFSFP